MAETGLLTGRLRVREIDDDEGRRLRAWLAKWSPTVSQRTILGRTVTGLNVR